MLPPNRPVHSIANLLLITIILTTVGCTGGLSPITLISTKNVDLETFVLDLRKGTLVTGEDCNISLLGVIHLGVPSLEEAVDDALEKGQGNILVDGYSYAFGYYAILYTYWCISVQGRVLKIPEKS